MNTPLSFPHHLDVLRAEQQRTRFEVERAVTAHTDRQAQLQNQIARLVAEAALVEAELQHLRIQQQMQADHRQVEEHRLIREGLGEAATRLVALGPYWRLQAVVAEQRAYLVAAIPDLTDTIAQYHAFAADPDAILASVPPTYRSALSSHHQLLSQQLAPLFEVEAEARKLGYEHVLNLPVLVAQNTSTDEVAWVLPTRSDLVADGSEPLLAEAIAAIRAVVQERWLTDPAWYIAELSQTTWEGFDALVALGEYRGGQPLPEHQAPHLAAALQATLNFAEMPVQVTVIALPWTLWEVGQGTATQEPLQVAAPLSLTEESASSAQPEAELPEPTPASSPTPTPELENHPWYTARDLQHWQRPLKVVDGSQWSAQARRMRTVLMRLIGHGIIGERTTNLADLSRDLPLLHAEPLRTGLERLLAASLLREAAPSPDSERRVSLNGDMLEQIQALINRDVTPFWADLLQFEPAAAAPDVSRARGTNVRRSITPPQTTR